ncbi:MAG: Undecaprenol kinase [candidate division WS2 bacterium]|nr:Undecaprenol kinase [Candidatus Psychracetigena formicireducens]MBT9137571.1 Undecaprenol kinase [Bacillota bacterium]MBT9150713.1 Undecaprenol kinase [Candidatus Psychracetigena formicireducens]
MGKSKRSLFVSFKHAIAGFREAFTKEKNLRIQLLLGLVAIILGIGFKITPVEWTILLLVISMVITSELFNTALERTLDLIDSNPNGTIKIAKDVAAGAVIFTAVIAIVIGLIIFIPRLIQLLAIFFY